MKTALILAAAAAGLVAAAPAVAAHLSPSATAAPRGTSLLLLGTGFAPPTGGCARPVVTIDGRPPRVTGRIFDDAGGWAVRIEVTQSPGNHVAVMTQRCGAKRAFSARAPFRALR